MMGISEDGRVGEKLARELLKKHGYDVFQIDWMSKKDNEYFLWEVKHQEYYKAPPFDGHGLPKWQVEARLKFQKETGIVVWFMVFEKPYNETKIIYIQRLDRLENGEYHDTKGLKPRRIYPLINFRKLNDS